MKLFLICWICLFIKIDNSNTPIQGTYSYRYGKTNDAPFGLLKIHAVKRGQYLFYLEIGKGAPSYDSGAAYGKLTYNERSGNYEYIPKDTIADCKLEFIRNKNKITIKTIAGDCGFGFGVYADGTYYLKDSKNPLYIISRANKKIYFNNTSPEKFRED